MQIVNTFIIIIFVILVVNDLIFDNVYALGRVSTLPNYIVFMADDLGYGDLGVYGHPTIQSPNIDRMAREGMKFTQAYSSASTCTPSRAGFQTARYAIRSGFANTILPVIVDPAQPSGIPYNETTIAETLKTAGYKTAMIGKWHLGINKYKNGDGLNLPMHHGYDLSYIFPVSNNHECNPNSPGPISCILMHQNKILEQPTDMLKLTRRLTEETIRFIRDNEENPFFIVVNYLQVHTALFASEEFQNKSLRGAYGDNVAEMDWSVGRIVDYLRQMGLDSDTLVIFSSDNGPYAEEKYDGGSSGLLKGNKAQTWEGGMRVPMIAWWPGTIKPNVVSTALISHLDIYPTFTKLAKKQMPYDRIIDGVDMSKILLGTIGASPRTSFIYYCGNRINAIRMGPYKIHFATQNFIDPQTESCPFDFYIGGGGCSCSDGSLTFHKPPLLYHLEYDPSERYPLTKESFEDYDLITKAAVNEVEAHIKSVEQVEDQLSKLPKPNLQPCCNPPKCRCGGVDDRPYGWRVVQKFSGRAGGSLFAGDTYLDHLQSFMSLGSNGKTLSLSESLGFYTKQPVYL